MPRVYRTLMALAPTLFLSLAPLTVLASMTAQEYLPDDAALAAQISPPEAVLGWNVGEWHVRHDQLVRYMEVLAEQSDRVSMTVTGHTYEQRPLLLMAITSSGNQQQLEQLREAHLSGQGNDKLVLWMGYSVHGNEASGSNASLLLAYYLAASQDPWVQQLLDNAIILLDPSLNPDGLARFAHWANSNRSMTPVGDPNDREHNETWPGGRTNHYWFDLNRDWLLLVHPESRARIEQFHRWRPHVLTDFHEQGSNETYFFQPGVPSRQNPLTPDSNLALTQALATFHAEALDQRGQLYFTEERFDDYYYGKGSTYPDINGSIGILFEQASARGHLMDTVNGPLPFSWGIGNQLATSISTLRGSWELRDRLRAYQADFDNQISRRASAAGHAGWAFADDGDPARARQLVSLLRQHQIDVQPVSGAISIDGREWPAGSSWFVPANQDKFGLAEAMFETRTEFLDETFYDVSTWTLPLAYNLPYQTLRRAPALAEDRAPAAAGPADADSVVAWALPWRALSTGPVLARLQAAGVPVRATARDLSLSTSNGVQTLPRGGLLVTTRLLDADLRDSAFDILQEAAASGLPVYNVQSAMTGSGHDLGSNQVQPLQPVKPLLLTGRGASGYDAGEVWHLLDTRIGLPPVMVESERLQGINLDDYSHLIMVDGDYSVLSPAQCLQINGWVNRGGILVTSQGAAAWAQEQLNPMAEMACLTPEARQAQAAAANQPADETEEESALPERRAYSDYSNDLARRVVGGMIAETHIDTSHPLAFGIHRELLPVFRNGTTQLTPSANAYATVARFTDEPRLSGFIGPERHDELRGQAAVIAEHQGRGLVVRLAFNPNFRGYWLGTQPLLVNSLFLGQLVTPTLLN